MFSDALRTMSGFVGLLVLAGLGACSPRASGPDVTRSDSAGVAVVMNAAEGLSRAPAWRLSSKPTLKIRTAENGAGPVLYRVTSVALLPDGGIAVGNGGTTEVLVFDSGGRLVHTAGGKREGPGTLQRIESIVVLPGDSLGVYDPTARRFSVFTSAGAFARSFDTGPLVPPGGSLRMSALAGGDLVLFGIGGLGRNRHPGIRRTPAETFVVSASGEVLDTVGSFPGDAAYVSATGGSGALLFGARTGTAVAGDRLVVGLGDASEYRLYDRSGTLTRIVRWPDHPRAVTEADVKRYIDAAVTTVPEGQRAMARRILSDAPHADEAPRYERLFASGDGDVWVGLFSDLAMGPGTVRYGRRRWLVFAADGALRAALTTPEGFRLMAVRGDRAVGVYMDTLGVESVRVYAVVRG